MLVDANVLLYAVDEVSPFHGPMVDWLNARLNGQRRVGIPWQSLTAFLRISTNSRALDRPLSPTHAWSYVDDWVSADVVWIPEPTVHHAETLGALIAGYDLRGDLIPDAHLAALAIEHGLTVVSADTDFARFRQVRWENPLKG